MFSQYGYADGSGDFFIIIDSDKCDGCGICAKVCPNGVFIIVDQNPYDPLCEDPLAVVNPDKKNRIKYLCGACRAATTENTKPCVCACVSGAISHSW